MYAIRRDQPPFRSRLATAERVHDSGGALVYRIVPKFGVAPLSRVIPAVQCNADDATEAVQRK